MTYESKPMAKTLLMAIGLLGAICHGLPVADELQESPPTPTTNATELQEPIEGPPPPPPQPELVFAETPRNTETELGASVLLVCRTAESVAECRWSWQPLPPTHLPLPNTDDTVPQIASTNEVTLTTMTAATSSSPALAVRSFPAFGNATNDCSVRFGSIRHEQTGYWSCAVRRAEEETFTSTSPAKLTILHVDAVGNIEFVHHENSVETPAGSGTRLPCRTTTPVRECQWCWRQLNQSQPWDTEVRRFPADEVGCDLGLPAVRAEHEGVWTCGARFQPGMPFVQAPPLRLLISEVEFVQLSRDIQITAGETVFLRCLVNKPVFGCEWSWRPSNASKNSTLLRRFAPTKETDHDCSVRFKNILYEEEGLWTCGVRLTPDGILHEAPSTTVALLPSGKVNFTETPESTSAALGSTTTLHCATNGRVERCSWSWHPLGGGPNPEPTRLREFPGHGDLGRNCSLVLVNLRLEEQGYWTCQVYLAGINTIMTTAQAKLTIYEEEEVRFSELSQDIQISSGGTVSLRCVTSSRVEQCRWSLTPEGTGNTTVVVKQFAPAGPEGRDCSVKLSHALQEQEGLWTCGARLHARQNYTDAPPARLSLIEPEKNLVPSGDWDYHVQESITVTVWGVPHQMVNLACKTGQISFESECKWSHDLKLYLSETPKPTRKTKYTISMNHSSGVCSLQFTADEHDFGEWICEFIIDNPRIQARLGNASILLLNNSPDKQLGWLVGAITSTVLFLLIIVVVMVVYKTRLCNRRIPTFLETLPPSKRKRHDYVDNDNLRVEGIPKIDLSYANPNFLSSPDSIRSVLPNRSPHLYERVCKRTPATSKTTEIIKE